MPTRTPDYPFRTVSASLPENAVFVRSNSAPMWQFLSAPGTRSAPKRGFCPLGWEKVQKSKILQARYHGLGSNRRPPTCKFCRPSSSNWTILSGPRRGRPVNMYFCPVLWDMHDWPKPLFLSAHRHGSGLQNAKFVRSARDGSKGIIRGPPTSQRRT